jgi:D-alanine-D-alanine ligase
MMKRCCIIYNEPREGALADELDVLDQVTHIEDHLKKLGISVSRKGITTRFMQEIAELAQDKPDFVFNLVESIDNKGELLYFVPALLNMYSIPYTGNSLEVLFATSNKTIASKTMKYAGIKNPALYFPSQSSQLVPGKKYIIKPIWEDGSLGINSESVFVCSNGFESKLEGLDDSHWFIEEFIDGREFNISVLASDNGPDVLPAIEIVFVNYEDKPRIFDFKAKWEMDSFEYINTVREFPGETLSPELIEKLHKSAVDCWHLFGLKGYARVDSRTDIDGNVYVVEINANPCISADAGFVAATKEAGYTFTEVLQRIINDLNN